MPDFTRHASGWCDHRCAAAEGPLPASLGAEPRLGNGVALSGKFDSELARNASTYAGTATLRVSW